MEFSSRNDGKESHHVVTVNSFTYFSKIRSDSFHCYACTMTINVKKTYSLNIELRTTTNYTCKTANIKIYILRSLRFKCLLMCLAKIYFADWMTEKPPVHENDTSEH
jgi:hypothetical protein